MVDNDEEVECNTIVRAREEGCDLAGGGAASLMCP
jgi:hypothetical protein